MVGQPIVGDSCWNRLKVTMHSYNATVGDERSPAAAVIDLQKGYSQQLQWLQVFIGTYIVEKVLEQWAREDQLQQLQWLKVVMVVIY